MSEDRTPEDERHHRRRRRLGWTLLGAGILVAGAIGVFAYLWTHSDARPVSLDEARRRFLEDRVTNEDPAGPRTPPAGVYQYTGSGSEELSTPPKSQTEGPEIPGTIQHREGGCWTFRLDYSTNHWRRWEFCGDADGLRERGSRVYQRWDFVVSSVDNLAIMRCRPAAVLIGPDMEPGDTWTHTCHGTNSAIAGETVTTTERRFVGRETLRVGGSSVEALHFRDRGVVSGAQSGSEEFDLWLRDDGLVLQGRQRIVIDSDSPIGNITYTQQGAFALVSTDPRVPGAPG